MTNITPDPDRSPAVAVFDRYLDELGTDENFEDVIFTKNVA